MLRLLNALSFIEKSLSLHILPPRKLRKYILPSPEKNFLTVFENSGLDAIKKLHFRLWKKKILIYNNYYNLSVIANLPHGRDKMVRLSYQEFGYCMLSKVTT